MLPMAGISCLNKKAVKTFGCLFYYGMLTIKGTRGSKLILGIPNNNVRKQYYGYLEEEYQAKSYVDTSRLTDYYYDMAYDGVWEEGLRFMADAYAKVSLWHT